MAEDKAQGWESMMGNKLTISKKTTLGICILYFLFSVAMLTYAYTCVPKRDVVFPWLIVVSLGLLVYRAYLYLKE